MDTENKVLMYATAFATIAGGILMLSFVPATIGVRQTQKAQAFNLMANGHRMISLANTYDAKAAAMQIKTIAKEIV